MGVTHQNEARPNVSLLKQRLKSDLAFGQYYKISEVAFGGKANYCIVKKIVLEK